jgi:hypothetical protein
MLRHILNIVEVAADYTAQGPRRKVIFILAAVET